MSGLTATILYPYDKRILDLFFAEKKDFPRAHYAVTEDAKHVIFSITAHDATAMRAATTTITRVLSVWESTIDHAHS